MEYDVFSANSSISSTGLKPLDVAKRRRNMVGCGREQDWMGGSDEGLDWRIR